MAAAPQSDPNESGHSFTSTPTNAIDLGIARTSLTDAHRALFEAHPRLLEAIRGTVGPRHFSMSQPVLVPEELDTLLRLGLAPDAPSLWFHGQKYLREVWGGGR
jgi:hypothetical protein